MQASTGALARLRTGARVVAARNACYERIVGDVSSRPAFDHFRLLARLGTGAGAMGVAAGHVDSGTQVALKVFYEFEGREAGRAMPTRLLAARHKRDYGLLGPTSRIHAAFDGGDSGAEHWGVHVITVLAAFSATLPSAEVRRLAPDYYATLADMERDRLGLGGGAGGAEVVVPPVKTFSIVTPLFGPSLDAVLRGRRRAQGRDEPLLPPAAFAMIALQVAKGLARCHEQWVVHRDIKEVRWRDVLYRASVRACVDAVFELR
jgi:serine/threonine protein kinase